MRNSEHNANRDLFVSASETARLARKDKNDKFLKAEQQHKAEATIFLVKYFIAPMVILLVLALAYIAFKVFTK